MTGLHTEITLSFLVVGHTKFASDWFFDYFKRLYRRTKMGSLKVVAQVVNNSARYKLVCDENGKIFVLTYDWTGSRFR